MRRARHRHPHSIRDIAAWLGRLLLSFLYLMTAAVLLLFGYIVGWDLEPGRPVLGTAMLVAGSAVFVLGPRAIRKLTGRAPIDPPPYT